jgi:topoisomerase-4 subunit A
MNVLDARGVPRVMGLPELLQAFLDHRMEVLVRRTRHRLARIAERLEIVDGYLRAFVDLDRVIAIVREAEDPRAELIAAFALTPAQAEAILNLRLRNLRKLEELELRREQKALRAERRTLQALLGDESRRRAALKEQALATLAAFGDGPLGARRTGFAAAPAVDLDRLEEVAVERYPVTVLLSQKGWVRVQRGRIESRAEVRYKEGDGERFVLEALSTDKLLAFASDGRCYLLLVDRLPAGRGQGEPLSLAIDLAKGAEIVGLRVHTPDGRVVVATKGGRGFVAREADVAAQTRAGKQVVNLAQGDALQAVAPVEGELVVVLGTNRKLLVFPLAELPEMARGRGVILQRYKGAALADVRTLRAEEGLVWASGERQRREADLGPWRAARGSVGRNPPLGFPRDGRLP